MVEYGYSTILIIWYRTISWNISKLYTSKIFVLQKKEISAINNPACNEYPMHTLTVTKSLNFLIITYKLQVSNYIFQLLHSNIDKEIESSLLINNLIHSRNKRTNIQMSILRVNRSKTKQCVLHNGMIT